MDTNREQLKDDNNFEEFIQDHIESDQRKLSEDDLIKVQDKIQKQLFVNKGSRFSFTWLPYFLSMTFIAIIFIAGGFIYLNHRNATNVNHEVDSTMSEIDKTLDLLEQDELALSESDQDFDTGFDW